MTAAVQRAARVRPHETSNEWWTPLHIIDQLGSFDLDPCAPESDPGRTGATRHFTIAHNGLLQPWRGRVWLNPPYSTAGRWVKRLADHGDGIALVFARTETAWWFDHVWDRADALLFLRGRISFIRGDDGNGVGHNAAAPSVLIAFGGRNAEILRGCPMPGAFVDRRNLLVSPTPAGGEGTDR